MGTLDQFVHNQSTNLGAGRYIVPNAGHDHLTRRGATTKAKLVSAAATLMRNQGVAGTTLDQVRLRSGLSKSQLYWHFPNKQALVVEVARFRASEVLRRERRALRQLASISGLEDWRDQVVGRCLTSPSHYACVLGTLATELSAQDDQARSVLDQAFTEWRGLLLSGLQRMRTSGDLTADADPERLASLLMAALQGGHVLSTVASDPAPLQTALSEAIDRVRSFSPLATPG